MTAAAWVLLVAMAAGALIGAVALIRGRWPRQPRHLQPRHRRTDPACSRYRPIRGPFARWRDLRSRGRACLVCWAGWRWTP